MKIGGTPNYFLGCRLASLTKATTVVLALLLTRQALAVALQHMLEAR